MFKLSVVIYPFILLLKEVEGMSTEVYRKSRSKNVFITGKDTLILYVLQPFLTLPYFQSEGVRRGP